MAMIMKNKNGYFRDGIETSADEYDAALTEIKEKATLVEALHAGRIAIADVPAEWQEEIQRRVDERIAAAQEEPDLTADEALDIILGGAV